MAKRIRLQGPGIPEHHGQPFPAAIKIGNMVFSAATGGEDPATGKLPEGLDDQVRHAFDNIRRMVEKAGGSPADIAKVTVTVKDRNDRPTVNKYWIAMFPDENDRPVRHTVAQDLAGGRLIQLEFIAVL
jgi:2-iminobutanoate/2-iminopropanoate deaminase